MRIFGLLPAGGTSSRMGRPKLALPLGERTVLERVLDTLRAAHVSNVLVVLGPQVADMKLRAEKAGAWTLLLERQTPDMRATVECGLDWLAGHEHPEQTDAFLLLPPDQPTLDKEVIEVLIAAQSASPATASIWIPVYEGRRGHPALIGWDHVSGMRAWPAGEGLNSYLRAHVRETVEVPCSSREILCDLDTPADYERLQKLVGDRMAANRELCDLAVRHHQRGDLEHAEQLYRQVLQADPNHVSAHANLGVALLTAGRHEEALASFRQAVRLNPGHADAHNNLGSALVKDGRLEEAIACFGEALRLNPRHAIAHNNLENALKEHAGACNNLGAALKEQGRVAEAIECFRQALRSNPRLECAHNNLGNALVEQGQWNEAIACFREALQINPNYGNAHYNLGNILKDQGQWTDAVLCYRAALRTNPDHTDANNNLGNALFEQGELAEAAQCYRQVLRLNPRHANVYNNLGVVLRDQGNLAEAAQCFREALRTDDGNVDAYVNLALIFDRLGQRENAMEQYEEALRVNPRHEITLWNRSLLKLQKGDFESGWKDYEYRWAQPSKKARTFDKPRWDGSPLAGKTILVHAEQGIGDTIQFARYLPMVQERGGNVIFECRTALQGLLTGFPGVSKLVVTGTPLPPFDLQAPHLSLPGIFGTTLETIPANVPGLHIDPSLSAHWRKELGPLSGLKVGIVWQGNPQNPADDRRSVPLARFEPLARVEGVRLLSLQVGPGTEQLANVPFPIIDLGSRFNPDSLDDLAAVLLNVDLLITVETAAAHLAGALELPVWNLVAFNPCWRWLLERQDSPWYPSMRLFRQSRLGDWDGVFGGVAAALGDRGESDRKPKRMKNEE